MNAKLIGAVFILLASGGVGYILASGYRKELRYLHQMSHALEIMAWELQYRLIPLPDLCRSAANVCTHGMNRLFLQFAKELDDQVFPDAEQCMHVAMEQIGDLPKSSVKIIHMLGSFLGKYDLSGQLQGLDAVQLACRNMIQGLEKDKDIRIRNYQTLGFCAGAAIVIVLI